MATGKNDKKTIKGARRPPANAKKFSSTYQPPNENKGRPKKLISTLKDRGYTKTQVRDTMLVLIDMNKAELELHSTDPEATALEVIVAKALLKDMEKGTTWALENVLNRNIGLTMDEADRQHVLKVVVENRQNGADGKGAS